MLVIPNSYKSGNQPVISPPDTFSPKTEHLRPHSTDKSQESETRKMSAFKKEIIYLSKATGPSFQN
jgi:hypothetical protein